WAAVPGTVECDEQPATILDREVPAVVERHPVGRPVPRERDDGPGHRLASAYRFAVSAVLGLQHLLSAPPVVVTVRPTIIAARFQSEYLLRRQFSALCVVIELRPVGGELIAPVLSGKDCSGARIYGQRDGVADSRHEPLAVQLCLVAVARVEPPDATGDVEQRAGILARRLRRAIAHLAGVGGRTDVDVQLAVGAND